jgi:DNA-directed RNA polymerase subunit RPC12/RpoP
MLYRAVVTRCSKTLISKPFCGSRIDEGMRSACPNCSFDLGSDHPGGSRTYSQCPHCNERIIPVWWQRCLVAFIAVVLSVAIPASLGLVGMTLLFAGFLFVVPALMLTHLLFFMTIPAKYVRNGPSVTTLFKS